MNRSHPGGQQEPSRMVRVVTQVRKGAKQEGGGETGEGP